MSLVDFVEDYGVVILLVVVVMLSIGFIGYVCYCGWAEDAGRSVVLRDGSQSYACVVSRVEKTPHDCKPIEGQNDH